MKYRRRPIEIEAFQVTYISVDDAICGDGKYPDWFLKYVDASGGEKCNFIEDDNGFVDGIFFETPDGLKSVNVGDFIIKEVDGKLYSVTPEVFLKSYVAVDEDGDDAK